MIYSKVLCLRIFLIIQINVQNEYFKYLQFVVITFAFSYAAHMRVARITSQIRFTFQMINIPIHTSLKASKLSGRKTLFCIQTDFVFIILRLKFNLCLGMFLTLLFVFLNPDLSILCIECLYAYRKQAFTKHKSS